MVALAPDAQNVQPFLPDARLFSPVRLARAVRWWVWWYAVAYQPGDWEPSLFYALRYLGRPHRQYQKGLY